MSYISDIWLYPLQDWWRTVNEMSNLLHTGKIGNFIFCPVYGTRVWNQVLEPDNLHSWQSEIEVHFSERTKSSDHSEFKLWLLGQNLVDNWLLTLSQLPLQ